jgi:hypothetical protein
MFQVRVNEDPAEGEGQMTERDLFVFAVLLTADELEDLRADLENAWRLAG